MNAILRLIYAIRGAYVRPARADDEDGPLEGPGIGRGTYAEDAAVMIAEVRQRFHDDHFAHLKKGGRKLNVITTSDGHDKPAVHEIEEARPEPKATRKPSSRERLRDLRRQLREKQ